VFDLRWFNEWGAAQAARVLYFPSPEGTCEFVLTTTEAHLSEALSDLNLMKVTCQTAGPGEVLETNPLSQRL